MSELGGLKGGKQFSAYQAFIESVKRGEKAIVFGPCYVVLSRNKFDELTQHNYQKDADPRVGGWQPIATAPKDGRLIIGWLGREDEGRTAGVVWMPMRWHEPGVGDCQPIHWIPLPTPPRETGGR